MPHAWLLAQPQVNSVISGAMSVEHVQANAASWDRELSKEDLELGKRILDDN